MFLSPFPPFSSTMPHTTHSDGHENTAVTGANSGYGKEYIPQTGRSTLKSICLVVTCTAAMVVNSSNGTSASIALPTIGQDLNIVETKLQWLVSAYSLSSGCLLLVFGRLADLYGRKKMFTLGTLWLAAFSLGCGFVNDQITLDILRGLQGIGAAATIPASLGILAHAFPPSRARSLAFATFAAGAPVGAAFGMAVGGVLTELSAQSWRSIFYLSTGLTVLCLVGGLISIDPDVPSTETDRRVDWLGAFLVTLGLVLIFFVLGEGEIVRQKWDTPYIIALLVIGVFSVLLFLFWQGYLENVQLNSNAPYLWWTPPPLMKLSLWGRANGRFAVMMWIAFFTWSSFLGWNFWVQLYYQDYIGYSPVRTMVRMLPMFVTGIICNLVVAMVVGRVPVIYLIAIGTIFTSAASLLFALIVPSAPYWAFGFPSAIFSVFGADFVFAAGTLFIAKVALPHEQSLAGALFQTMTQLGTALGVTVTTIVFNRVIQQDSEKMGVIPNTTASNVPNNAKLSSYKAAQWTAFAFGILATILALVFFRGVGIVGHHKSDKEGDSERTVTNSPVGREVDVLP